MNILILATAALTLTAGAQADDRCSKNADCAATYPKYAALFEARWDMERYRAFLTRYNEFSKDRDYTLAAQAAAPLPPASESAWYDKWAYRLPHNPKPWTLDYETLNGEIVGFANGFNEARSLSAELRSLNDHDRFKSRLHEKIKGAFPGDMGREKFKVIDVIYAYLGAAERDFFLKKLQYLGTKPADLAKRGFTADDAKLYTAGGSAALTWTRAQNMAEALAVVGGGNSSTMFLAGKPAAPQAPAAPAKTAPAATVPKAAADKPVPAVPASVRAEPAMKISKVQSAAPVSSRHANLSRKNSRGHYIVSFQILANERDRMNAALAGASGDERAALLAQRARVQHEINHRAAAARARKQAVAAQARIVSPRVSTNKKRRVDPTAPAAEAPKKKEQYCTQTARFPGAPVVCSDVVN